MRLKILRACASEITGQSQSFGSVDEALEHLYTHKGWDSREQLHKAIRIWAEHATIGEMFCTQNAAIIAVRGPGIRKPRKSKQAEEEANQWERKRLGY